MSLEDKVNDKKSKGFIKKALKLGFKLGMATLTTAYSLSTVGTLGVVVGGALAAGGAIGGLIKKEPLYNIIDNALTSYSTVNAIIHPMVWLGDNTFHLIDNTTLAGKAARTLYTTTLYNAAFVGSFRASEHLIDNYLNPKGITKTVSDNFWNRWARVGVGFLPGYALVANNITSLPFGYFGIEKVPAFAANALPFGIYNSAVPLPQPKKQAQSSYIPQYASAPAHA